MIRWIGYWTPRIWIQIDWSRIFFPAIVVSLPLLLLGTPEACAIVLAFSFPGFSLMEIGLAVAKAWRYDRIVRGTV